MIIGLCGLKQHGKSTVAEFLRAEHGFKVFAFADALRQMLETLDPYVTTDTNGVQHRYSQWLLDVGYEQAKQIPEVRRLLQVLGTECGRRILGEQVWVNALAKAIDDKMRYKDNIVVPDMRFQNEVEFLKTLGAKTARVARPTMPVSGDMHESERYASDLLVDYTIVNNGTLGELRLKTFAMLAKLDCSQERA